MIPCTAAVACVLSVSLSPLSDQLTRRPRTPDCAQLQWTDLREWPRHLFRRMWGTRMYKNSRYTECFFFFISK